jgi:transposase-like protein
MSCPICNNSLKKKAGKYYGAKTKICNACNVFFYEETLKRRYKIRPFLPRYNLCLENGMNPINIGKNKKFINNKKFKKKDHKLLILINVLESELKNI